VAVREEAADAAGVRLVEAVVEGGLDGARDLTRETLRRLVETWDDGVSDLDQQDVALVALGLHDKPARDEAMTLVLDHEPGMLVSLLTELARRTSDVEAAPVCTVLAWAAYAQGGGALAAVAAERALRCEPGYAMAELVLEGLGRMVTPGAVRQICADVRAELSAVAGAPGHERSDQAGRAAVPGAAHLSDPGRRERRPGSDKSQAGRLPSQPAAGVRQVSRGSCPTGARVAATLAVKLRSPSAT
jgi:hypothetical protein